MVEKNLTLCALPFIHLSTHPNGLVTPCCNANYENGISFSKTNNRILSLDEDSIDDIMNSDSFIEIRRKMLNNEQPIECIGCYNAELNNIKSKRIEENEKRLHGVKNLDDFLPNIELKFIELRLGNVCNSKCLTCNPMSSKLWISDVKKFTDFFDKDHYNYTEHNSEWYKNIEWYDILLTHCKSLEEIYINGGEPTLIKEHFYFLEKLIELKRSKDIRLIYNINCTNLPIKFVKLLRQFKHVKLQLSIDDLQDRNYYIRYPSNWTEIMKNYEKLKKEKFEISITQTISNLNICNVGKFREFFRGDKLEYNFVYNPNYLHVSNLSENLKNIALEQIEMLNQNDKSRFHYEINSKPYDDFLFKKFIKYINMMDKIRKINIKNYLNEYK